MAFLHAQQPPIAHRDLRSPNVFLVSLDAAAACCAKIADFGLSVSVTAQQTLTLDSWQWMAPETQVGANYTHQCDLYSFAMVVTEVFTQRIPYSEYDELPFLELKGKIQREGLRPKLPTFCPAWTREMLMQLWAHDPSRRPSFAAVVRCLEKQEAPPRLADQQRLAAPPVPVLMTRVVFESQDGAPLCMSSNACEVWLGCRNGELRVYSAKTAQQLQSERHPGDVKILGVWTTVPGNALSVGLDGTLRSWGDEASKLKSPATLRTLLKRTPSSTSVQRPGTTAGDGRTMADSTLRSSHGSLEAACGSLTALRSLRNLKSLKQSAERVPASANSFLGASGGLACVALFADALLLASGAGSIRAVSFAGEALAETTASGPVSCACSVAGTAWLSVSDSLCKATFLLGELVLSTIVANASKEPLAHLVHVGREVWGSTVRGDISIWDATTGQQKQSFALGVRFHRSMCPVEMHGAMTVWMGCADEVRVVDCATRSLRCALPLPLGGDVTCLTSVGIHVVWAGVRNIGSDKGSLYIFDFSQ
jgi:hypothetical protein